MVDVALRGFGGAVGSDASFTDTDDPEGVLLPASAKAKASSAGFFRKFTEKAKRLGRGPTVRVRVAAPPPRTRRRRQLPRALCASRFVPLLATFGSCASARRALLAKRKRVFQPRADRHPGVSPGRAPRRPRWLTPFAARD